MSILKTVYASNPEDEILIHTIEINIEGLDPIRVCNGFENQRLGVDGKLELFECANISISKPEKSNKGTQFLTFNILNARGIVQKHVDQALENDEFVTITYREYLHSDPMNHVYALPLMTVKGGGIEGINASFEASFQDILNTSLLRERYTSETAPGIRFL